MSDEDRKFIRSYLLGYINDDADEMMTAVTRHFALLERYLRENHAKFISLATGEDPKAMYGTLGVAGKKNLVLGDLFQIYSLVIQRVKPDNATLAGSWDDFVNIRNMAAHGQQDFSKHWREHIVIFCIQLPRIHRLKTLIEEVIGGGGKGDDKKA